MADTGCAIGPISGGCFTAIIEPEVKSSGALTEGEGEVIARHRHVPDRNA